MTLNLRKFIPEIKKPTIKLPRINAPKIRIPNFKRITARQLLKVRAFLRKGLKACMVLQLPKIKKPTIKLPRIQAPKINWKPNVKLSDKAAIICLSVLTLLLVFLSNSVNFWPSTADASQFSFIKSNEFMTAEAQQIQWATTFQEISPSSGTEPPEEDLNDGHKYRIEDEIIEVESVLIPNATTVISSSRDSKIKSINYDNGQLFKKGDVLVEYTCDDARAEVEIAKTQQKLTRQKKRASYKLFKLDIISDIERLELEVEDEQAEARAALHESRMKDCFIRAEYDGRVIKRLANAGEFTRTDRVLMEVASLGTLKAEFLLPSRALRWINIGAPIEITINETEELYPAKISHIYGEVDPISQSIQVTAQLEKYETPLLPGMSGTTTLDLTAIRKAGIIGFLETKSAQ